MGFHTFDVERADALEDPGRFERLSAEELIGAAALADDDRVLDVGSGTGFYTDVLASVAGRVYAVDVQPAMAVRYRQKGVPEGVRLLAADAGRLPLPADAIDVTCRLRADDHGTCVLGLTHRLTGEFLLEVNADADPILRLVDAARASDDEDATYRVRIEADDARAIYDKETLLVYDSDGNLLRGQSLIPSGVEL